MTKPLEFSAALSKARANAVTAQEAVDTLCWALHHAGNTALADRVAAIAEITAGDAERLSRMYDAMVAGELREAQSFHVDLVKTMLGRLPGA